MTKYLSPYVTSTLILLNWLVLLEGIFVAVVSPSFAQSNIVPDATLGVESSKVITNVNDLSRQEIIGGASREINLFHSFQEFNINEGSAVFFNNPAGIENILGRVTGNNPSNILGTLGVLGAANLFLLNPNGIIFGENASLNINGSFVATSANAIQFGEQGFFSVDDSNSPPLLTINPSAFFFNQMAAGAIQNQSTSGLTVAEGSSLLLLGGDVDINGGRLNALGGQVEIGGLKDSGTVGLNIDGNSFNLSFPTQVIRGDVSLSNQALVTVANDGGGSIAINANNLNLSGNSNLVAGIRAGLGSFNAQAGDIDLNATEAINISQGSFIENRVLENARGDAGNINVNAKSLNLREGGFVSASIEGQGNAGNINFNIDNNLNIDAAKSGQIKSGIYSDVLARAVGNGGEINLTVGSLTLSNEARLNTNTRGQGNAGNIIIDAQDFIAMDNSYILSNVENNAVGNGGEINLTADSLNLSNQTRVNSSTEGQGNTGNITLTATETIEISQGSRIENRVLKNARGDAGNINVNAKSLNLNTGGFVSASIEGQGNAGNINFNIDNNLNIDAAKSGQIKSGIYSDVLARAVGNGGEINLTVGSLTLSNEARLNTNTRGQGNAGNIIIDAQDFIAMDNSYILSNVENNAVGNGGEINLTADSLNLSNQTRVNSSTEGQGNTGNITLTATETIEISQGSRIENRVLKNARGDAGNINVNAKSLNLREGGFVSASIEGQGNAGNINFIIDDNLNIDAAKSGQIKSGIYSDVLARAVGNGGEINLTVGSLNLSNEARLNTNTRGQGNAGNIIIDAQDFIAMDNSYILSNVENNAVGNGGEIKLTTNSLTLDKKANITVNSNGEGDGGEVIIKAGSLTLQKKSSVTAETIKSQGGNIQLEIADLLFLRNNSSISTKAGNEGAGGNGGNITINTNFLVAFPQENNDITANAFNGSGGKIEISTAGIFGLEERSSNPPNQTNDIDASSQFGLDGTIVINQFDINPAQGLEELPTNIINVTDLVAQGCPAGSRGTETKKSQFILTGRGGVPPQPEETLRVPAIMIEDDNLANHQQQKSHKVTNNPIIEANSWRINAQGKVVLIASVSPINAHIYWSNLAKCHDF